MALSADIVETNPLKSNRTTPSPKREDLPRHLDRGDLFLQAEILLDLQAGRRRSRSQGHRADQQVDRHGDADGRKMALGILRFGLTTSSPDWAMIS